jgi:hypothetical protein
MHGTANRANAEKYGLTIRLCAPCHEALHLGRDGLDDKYKRLAQEVFEGRYSRELWMLIFGKNFLSE